MRNIDLIEQRLLNQQYRLIKERFGQKVAEKANYGWGTTGDEDYVSIATKVYGHGILESYGDVRGKTTHTFTEVVHG